ncbi:MAG TPA: SDR family NAD(P)-dependent oxidoreductase, partial [Acidimicrobiia bacterium]|nr:SDR family NAD(P)-dependent oxidoreductase [Acidimicrobiia bacterium]
MNVASIAGFTNLGYHLHARKFDPIEANMGGRTVLVTGATGGLGLETATTLADLGARVIIVGRSAAKLEAAQSQGSGRFVPERADLSLMEEVRHLADRIAQSEEHLDVLVNNVGVLLSSREVTDEGLEKTFATDLAGHFLLTNLLLPALARSGSARVVNVSSGGMYSARIDPDDLQFEKRPYTGTAAYASAKRGQVVLTELWAERFPGNEVVFHVMHPGWVNT